MIPLIAHCISKAFGVGSILCLNENAQKLIAELRGRGFAASSSEENEVDFLVLEDLGGDFSETSLLLPKAKKAIVFLLAADENAQGLLGRLYDAGYRLYPRASAFEPLSLQYGVQICVVERATESQHEIDIPSLNEAASMWAEVSNLVMSRGDILVGGPHADLAARIVFANSRPGSVIVADEGEISHAFDLIVLTTDKNQAVADVARYQGSLKPGGRIVLGIFSSEMEVITDKNWLTATLPSSLYPEALYIVTGAAPILQESVWLRYDLKEQWYWAQGWQAIVLMRSPFDAEYPFPLSDFPVFPFDDLLAQYENPWLSKALVSIQTRIKSPEKLEKIADDVIASNGRGTDRAAAFCVKAYLILGRDESWEQVRDLINNFTPFLSSGDKAEPIEIRWAISLLFVKGLLEQKYGQRELAKSSFEQCANGQFMRFAPMLATKTISACRQLAFMSLSEGDDEGAKSWFALGVEQCVAASASIATHHSAPYPLYVLPEITYVLSLGAQCNSALIALGERRDAPIVLDAMRCDIVSQIESERLASDNLRMRLSSASLGV